MNTALSPLVFAHIGDPHITTANQQNYLDFLSIVAQLATECGDNLDFVIIPGDIADNGRPEQYALVDAALRMLKVPVHILAGDHDMEQGNLNNLYTLPPAHPLPYCKWIKGNCCIFLDTCGPGKGGPDFRLGADQLTWLEATLQKAKEQEHTILLFMHVYPDDLKEQQEKTTLLKLIRDYRVLLVDMGHTHYNEIANDGVTLYTATRSTGQIEEGIVGYSLVTVDQNLVSWRFKPLAEPFPLVLITHPADHRLQTKNQSTWNDPSILRVVVLGAQPIAAVTFTYDKGNTLPLVYEPNSGCYTTILPAIPTTPITVTAIDGRGRPGIHSITPSEKNSALTISPITGSDHYAIGPWPENGIFGTQLGPNRNAKPPKHK